MLITIEKKKELLFNKQSATYSTINIEKQNFHLEDINIFNKSA